jgi:hypothetical protein
MNETEQEKRTERKRTAVSASAMTRLDLSRSFLSCAVSAISEARRRRFSTYSDEICALSSSMRTLRVELSLMVEKMAVDKRKGVKRSERDGKIRSKEKNGLGYMFVGEQEFLLDCFSWN